MELIKLRTGCLARYSSLVSADSLSGSPENGSMITDRDRSTCSSSGSSPAPCDTASHQTAAAHTPNTNTHMYRLCHLGHQLHDERDRVLRAAQEHASSAVSPHCCTAACIHLQSLAWPRHSSFPARLGHRHQHHEWARETRQRAKV